ncbi:MAG: DUF2845 domain-containing protein [Gammaproteobacteria bacterium]|nr:DUF2845 domain-containing protein [Gammaproteobacteria bacterium]
MNWLIGGALAFAAAAASSADAFRCGNRLITRGDHAARVLRYCGEPDAIESRVAVRGVFAAGALFLPGFYEEIEIEEWTYNLGPHKLMRSVYLENGKVRGVDTLGYGYHD